MNHQRLLWNMHCVATVVLRKQLNFKSTVIRSKRSSCSGRCLFYFQCSPVNIYKHKGKYLLRRIPHASHGSFNPLVISNKQAHIINGNIPVALRCVTFFSHASEPLRTINTFVNVLQFFSHTKELLIIQQAMSTLAC